MMGLDEFFITKAAGTNRPLGWYGAGFNYGGVGGAIPDEVWVIGSGLIAVGLLVMSYWNGFRLSIPPYWWGLIIFLGLWLISYLWLPITMISISYWGLWLTAAGWWVLAYSWRIEWRKEMDKAVLVIGLIFGGLYLLSILGIISNTYFGFGSLVVADSANKNHFHWGDWWMLVVILEGVKYYRYRAKKDLFIIVIGLVIVFLSESRSALLGLLIALWLSGPWLGSKKSVYIWRRWLMAGLLLGIAVWGSFKGVFHSRLYFIQAIEGIIEHPLGVGMGRFYMISRFSNLAGGVFREFSFYTHNLWLEFMVGLGVWAVWFVAWYGVVVYKAISGARSWSVKTFALALIALGVNFALDTTYMIPSMILIFFVLLGLTQEMGIEK